MNDLTITRDVYLSGGELNVRGLPTYERCIFTKVRITFTVPTPIRTQIFHDCYFEECEFVDAPFEAFYGCRFDKFPTYQMSYMLLPV